MKLRDAYAVGVIRRILLISVAALLLSACGQAGGTRSSIEVGSESISREDFVGYAHIFHILDGRPESLTGSTFPADSMRAAAQNWIAVSSLEQVLEADGTLTIGDAERLQAEQDLKDIIDQTRSAVTLDDFVAGFSPGSAGYDDIVDFVVLVNFANQQPELLTQAQNAEARQALLTDAFIESRIGVISTVDGAVLPPGSDV